MSEIIGIGSSVYDTLMTVSEYPPEDTKKESSSLVQAAARVQRRCCRSIREQILLRQEYWGNYAAWNYMMEDSELPC